MAAAKAYGSITIVDIGDLGTLSVVPESNQPSSVIYDPNQVTGNNKNEGYNPDWTQNDNNLTLTPTIYYGGEQIQPDDSAVRITWKKKIGSGSVEAVSSSRGETVTNGVLTVTQNVMSDNSPLITYLCTVEYTEPNSGIPLTAKGQISFSLIVQPTKIKSCSITGESVFRYNSEGNLEGATSIELSAHLSNCSITNWQYKTGSGYETIKIDGTPVKASSITIVNDDSYFINDVATIRLNTSEDGLYDLHTITKIRDGAAGTSTLSAVLTNEDIWIPCDAQGTPTSKAFEDVTTQIIVYNGMEDVTSKAEITCTPEGVEGTWTKPSYKVTGLTSTAGDVAKVSFTIKYDGKTIVKVFNLTKLKAGIDGVTPTIYSLKTSTAAVKVDKDGYPSPNNITLSAYKIQESTEEYTGRFRLFGIENDGRETEITLTDPDNDKKSVTYTINTTKYSTYRAELYASGGKTTLLDSQSIIVVKDGANGISAKTLSLDNDSDTISRASGTGTIRGLPIEVKAKVYDGATSTGEAVALKSVPTNFVAATDYSYVDNKLTISAIPTGFNGGSFVFSYGSGVNALEKTFTLRVVDSTENYRLNVQKAVINATSSGSVSITAIKTGVEGPTEFKQNTDFISLYIDGAKTANGKDWTLSYNAGQMTPIRVELRDKNNYTWDTETIQFVENGAGAVNLALSNDRDSVSRNAAGQLFGIDSTHPITTKASVYQGAKELSGATVALTSYPKEFGSSSLNNSYAVYANNELQITSIPTNFTKGDFVFTYTNGGATFTKTFSLTVEESSINYDLIVDKTVVNATEAGNIKVTVNKHDANGLTPLSTTDNFIKLYKNGGASAISSWTISYDKGQTSPITLTLKDTSGKVWDEETIEFVKDGATGSGGLTMLLGNNADMIPCLSNGNTASAHEITIPFSAYVGIDRVDCEATVGTLPSGFGDPSITSASKTADGEIKIVVEKDKDLGGVDSGVITITLTVEGKGQTTLPFAWSKNRRGVDGSNGISAVLLRTFTPNGNVLNNGEGTLKLSYILTEGNTNVSGTTTWYAYNFGNSTYEQVEVGTGAGGYELDSDGTSLIVPGAKVDSYGSYKVAVVYGGKTYEDYISVYDKTDPLQVEVFSTLGDKITNSVGVGCIYARVTRNGEELDALKNLTVSEKEPTEKAIDDIWAQIVPASNGTAGHILVKKYTATGWETVTNNSYVCNYTWTFGDYYGNKSDLNNQSSVNGKFLYIDGSLINKKKQFNLEVTMKA